MKTRIKTFLAAGLLMALGTTAQTAIATTLDFELGAPCTFGSTTPLASLGGVTFTGVDGDGGSVLNECSNFGQSALSGTDFYAFNTDAGTGSIVDLTFEGLISDFSIYASQGSQSGTSFMLEAFDSADVLVASTSAVPSGNEWAILGVFGADEIGIERIRLSFTGGPWGIFDDLTYSLIDVEDVPEPTTLALLGLGLVGMGLRRRKAS